MDLNINILRHKDIKNKFHKNKNKFHKNKNKFHKNKNKFQKNKNKFHKNKDKFYLFKCFPIFYRNILVTYV